MNNFPNISCLKYTVNLNFHLIRSKTLPMKDFELTVPDLYVIAIRSKTQNTEELKLAFSLFSYGRTAQNPVIRGAEFL